MKEDSILRAGRVRDGLKLSTQELGRCGEIGPSPQDPSGSVRLNGVTPSLCLG